ncbi:hypothetical protein DSUL_30075 [Desulfovibrionales bacterium]
MVMLSVVGPPFRITSLDRLLPDGDCDASRVSAGDYWSAEIFVGVQSKDSTQIEVGLKRTFGV